MKKIITCTACSLIFGLSVYAQVRLPQSSSTQTIIQNFGMGKVELTYSRPSIKSRAVFTKSSELAPLGQLWRTGANAATKVKFTEPVTVGGNKLDTGSYALYTIPGEKEWTIIFNKGIQNWGTTNYKEADDVARFNVKVEKMKGSMETFTMQFADVQPQNCELHIMWGNTAVSIPITTDVKHKLRAQIETALQSAEKKPFYEAATYYYEYEKDYTKALDNANKAIEANANAFWIYLLKAKIQKAAGDKQGAKASAEKTIEVATAQKNDDYIRSAKELIKTL